jgi:hypothetical protein
MQLVKTIPNVMNGTLSIYMPSEDAFYLDIPTKQLKRLGESLIESSYLDVKTNWFFIWNNLMQIDNNLWIDINTGKIIKLNVSKQLNEVVSFICDNQKYLIFAMVNEEIEVVKYYLIKEENYKYISELKHIKNPHKVFNNNIICLGNNSLICCDFLLKKWELSFFDLMGPGNVNLHSDIIVHGNKIFFYLSGTELQRTFCVDLETGKVLKEYSELQGFSRIEGNNLYNLFFEKLTVLDLLTNTLKVYNLEYLLVSNGIERVDYDKWLVKKGLIYFVQTKGADKNFADKGSVVAILDPFKSKLLWQYTFHPECGLIGSIQATNKRLYVHTQDKTLHVFEKHSD